MAITNRYSNLARPDLIITDYPFLIHSMEKGSENSIKSLTAIQRSDQKLWPFQTVTQAWRDHASSSPSIVSSSTQWKRASGNSSNSLTANNGRIKSYGHFEPLLKPGATKPHLHRVSIPHPLHAKGHPETPVRV